MEGYILIGILVLIAAWYFYQEHQKNKRAKQKERELTQQATAMLEQYRSAWSQSNYSEVMSIGQKMMDSRLYNYSQLAQLYEHSLTMIKIMDDGKVYALKAGRACHAHGRKDNSLTIYDEAAIQNDLFAHS